MPAQKAADVRSPAGVVEVVNPQGASDVVLVCEHASNFIPPEMNSLGLGPEARTSHIAWDPGALGVARTMSQVLDATLVAQRVSRLVYDCNRPPESPSAVPAASEVYSVPGNFGLGTAALAMRAERFYFPFCDTLAALLDSRVAAARPPIIVTIHSFTPVYLGVARTVEIGVLHDADARLADAMLALGAGDLVVRRNEPYGPADGVTHTLVVQALPRGLLNVMIEVRNDLIADAASQERFGTLVAGWVTASLASLGTRTEKARHA